MIHLLLFKFLSYVFQAAIPYLLYMCFDFNLVYSFAMWNHFQSKIFALQEKSKIIQYTQIQY